MKVIPPTASEVIFRQAERMLMTNPLMMSDYWTTLFNTFKGIIDEDDEKILDRAIIEIERWISDDFNPMTLPEAEVLMFQNMDLYSGFEVNGQMITQQEINQRLQQVKTWLQQLLYGKYMPQIRFTQAIKIG